MQQEVSPQESLYDTFQAARYLGLHESSIRSFTSKGRITFVLHEGVRQYTRAALDAYDARRKSNKYQSIQRLKEVRPTPSSARASTSPEYIQLVTAPSPVRQVPPPPLCTPGDEQQVWLKVVSSVFSFLQSQGLEASIQGFHEVQAATRFWEIVTPTCTLRVIAQDGSVEVLSDTYQQYLKTMNQDLSANLRAAQGTLATLRKKPVSDVLGGYARPVPVEVEHTPTGVLVHCPQFGRVSWGRDSESALASMHVNLWGYVRWLDAHQSQEQFTDEMRRHYHELLDLLTDKI